MRTNDLFKFIRARHDIYLRRAKGLPKPWTDDPILQQYRFCNVYRELDTVTQWIAENWRPQHPHAWFAMVVARLVNWPDTLAAIGYPCGEKTWHKQRFIAAINNRAAAGQKAFTSAYMIHAGPTAGIDKATYLANEVLDPIWRDRTLLAPRQSETLASWHERLMCYKDMGSFMAAQIVCDVKYIDDSPLAIADDWATFAAPGPGSQRGLNRVLEHDVNTKWSKGRWLDDLCGLRMALEPLIKKARMPNIHAQDLQNCLCEFDKYERVRLGEGKPRQKYNGLK